MTSAAFPAVARVLDVSDTREYELAAGPSGRMRWRPIPGTGEPRPCDRCGRDHQVWVDVECVDGSRRTVGTGCAEVAGLDALASRLATGAAEVERLAHMLAAAEAILPASAPAPAEERTPDGLRVSVGDHARIVPWGCPRFARSLEEARGGVRGVWACAARRAACGGEDPAKVRKALKTARAKLEGERRRAGLS